MAFYTIFIPRGLSEARYRRALRIGAREITTWRRHHRDLLESAGFKMLEESDATPEFRRVKRALTEARERHANELRAEMGAAEFDRWMREQRAELRAAEDGLLQRSLFVTERAR